MKLTRPLFANSATGRVGDIGHIRATATGFFFIKQSALEKKTTLAEINNRLLFKNRYAGFRAAGFRLRASWLVWIHNLTRPAPVNRGALSTGRILVPIRVNSPAPVSRGALSTGRILEPIKK